MISGERTWRTRIQTANGLSLGRPWQSGKRSCERRDNPLEKTLVRNSMDGVLRRTLGALALDEGQLLAGGACALTEVAQLAGLPEVVAYVQVTKRARDDKVFQFGGRTPSTRNLSRATRCGWMARHLQSTEDSPFLLTARPCVCSTRRSCRTNASCTFSLRTR